MYGKATIAGFPHIGNRHRDLFAIAISDDKLGSAGSANHLSTWNCCDRVGLPGDHEATARRFAEECFVGQQRQGYLAADPGDSASLSESNSKAALGDVVGCDDRTGADSITDGLMRCKCRGDIKSWKLAGWGLPAASCKLGGSQVRLERADKGNGMAVSYEATVGDDSRVRKLANHSDYWGRKDRAVWPLVVEAYISTDNWNSKCLAALGNAFNCVD
jgi:hypothetical protein